MNQSKSDKKHALLNDLESIKQLLTEKSDDVETIEPPLLESLIEAINTNPEMALENDVDLLEAELPLLTNEFDDNLDSLEPPLLNTLTAEAELFADEDIPLLEAIAGSSGSPASAIPEEIAAIEEIIEGIIEDDIEAETQAEEITPAEIIEEETEVEVETIEDTLETPAAKQVEENKAAPTQQAATDGPVVENPAEKTPAQASLFEEPGETTAKPQQTPTAPSPKATAPKTDNAVPTESLPSSENPFLPKHIRERLHINRTLQQEIAGKNQTIAKQEPAKTTPKPPQRDEKVMREIVDKIIARHLPVMERDLRSMLIAALRQLEDTEEK